MTGNGRTCVFSGKESLIAQALKAQGPFAFGKRRVHEMVRHLRARLRAEFGTDRAATGAYAEDSWQKFVLGEPFRRRPTFRVAMRRDRDVFAPFRVEVSEACLPPLRSSARSSRASSAYASDRGRAFSRCLPSLLLETHRSRRRFVLSSQDYVPFGTPHGRSALIGHRFDRPRAHRARRLCMLQIQIRR